MRRRAIHAIAVSFAGVAIMLAAEGSASARSAGGIASSPPHMGTSSGTHSGSQPGAIATQASWRGGYGRGWCYWHPYACYRFNQ